jgi:putative transposase
MRARSEATLKELRSGGVPCHDWIMKYKTGSSTKHRILVHLVILPKYRRRVLIGKIALRIKQLFTECCSMNDWQVHELAILKDHIHMLIQINPKDSIASAVNLLKGGSSRAIRLEHPELQEFLWGESFWSDGYFAETIGAKSEEMLRKYIQNQS